MGWAIRRLDGTYRCWNANSRDDALGPGEVWDALASAPVITADPLTPAQVDSVAQSNFDTNKALKALALAVLDELNALRAAVIPALPARTLAQLRQAVIDKYKALP